ncbi:MAG: glutaredoxin family protein [Lysobacterales bacterium]
MRITLYRRSQCSLCDLAEAMLVEAGIDFDAVWLEDDAAAEQHYGWRIPVLRRDDSGAELDWPFDSVKLRQYVFGGSVLGFRF